MDWGRKDRIAREAAEWVVLIDSEAFDAGAAVRFRRWLEKSEEHRAAFQLASRAWTDLDQLGKLKAYPEIVALLKAPAREGSVATDCTAPDRRVLILGAGAGVALVGIAGYALLNPGAAEAFETGIGEQREVALADGTQVYLNADTRIEARVRRGGRSARVVRGEALFSIAVLDNAMFSIATAGGGVEAASGEVLVKVLPAGARISLLSGAGRAWRDGLITREARVGVEAMSEVELEHDGLNVVQVEAPVLSRRTLWRDGRLAFDDAPLSEAVADVSRQTGVRFECADPALGDLRIGGLIDARDLDSFLLMLRQSLAINARRREDGVIVLSRE